MVAPLTQYAKEQPSVIPFLWAVDVKAGDIYRRITIQYGDNYRSQRKVHRWLERFKGGQTSAC
jgi:hypothetical protein